MLNENLLIFIPIEFLLFIISVSFIPVRRDKVDVFFFLPNRLYKDTKLSKFGSIIVFLLFSIVFHSYIIITLSIKFLIKFLRFILFKKEENKWVKKKLM